MTAFHCKCLRLASRLPLEIVLSDLLKEVAMLGSPCGRNCRWPLGAKSSLQPTPTKKPFPLVPQTQGNELNEVSLKTDSSPVKPPDVNADQRTP